MRGKRRTDAVDLVDTIPAQVDEVRTQVAQDATGALRVVPPSVDPILVEVLGLQKTKGKVALCTLVGQSGKIAFQETSRKVGE
jgi:hypothetical protein